jgi:hypothetical protein
MIYMQPVTPGIMRPNPLLVKRKKRKNPSLGGGRMLSPFAGAALTVATDMALVPIISRPWNIPIHLGIAFMACLFPAGNFVAGLAGAQLTAAAQDLGYTLYSATKVDPLK